MAGVIWTVLPLVVLQNNSCWWSRLLIILRNRDLSDFKIFRNNLVIFRKSLEKRTISVKIPLLIILRKSSNTSNIIEYEATALYPGKWSTWNSQLFEVCALVLEVGEIRMATYLAGWSCQDDL